MIRCGLSTPQEVTLSGTGFVAGALVLVTRPDGALPEVVTPLSVTSTTIVFLFVFDTCGDYQIRVTDETGTCDLCPSDVLHLAPTPLPCPDGNAFFTLGELIEDAAHKLGDDGHAIWLADTIRQAILDGYRILATEYPVFWDQVYAENLPAGFSVTQPWELLLLDDSGDFNYGVGNFTAEFERRAGLSLGFDERLRVGPANHTSPFEATDGLLVRARASTAIPATSELPKTLTKLDRVEWDLRYIEPLEPRTYSKYDSRYEITKGEVFGYTWQKDGVRTLRKIRVPAVQADTWTVNGSWGLLRAPSDLSTTTPTGTWGIARRIEGQHPLGPELFGAPRRVYRDGKNVRVEHFRQGRVLLTDNTLCELPPRYARYLVDYARARCLSQPGPGYDEKLAAHFLLRWERGIARLDRRLDLVDMEHVFVAGGDGQASVGRPPRPSLPWAYGSRVR